MDSNVKAIALGERTSRRPLYLRSERFESSEWVRSKRSLPSIHRSRYTPLSRKDGKLGRTYNGEFEEQEPNRVKLGNKIYFDYGRGIRFMGLAEAKGG